jgi:hypothetical protein
MEEIWAESGQGKSKSKVALIFHLLFILSQTFERYNGSEFYEYIHPFSALA